MPHLEENEARKSPERQKVQRDTKFPIRSIDSALLRDRESKKELLYDQMHKQSALYLKVS